MIFKPTEEELRGEWRCEIWVAPGASLKLIKEKMNEGFTIEFEDENDKREVEAMQGGGYRRNTRRKSRKRNTRRKSRKSNTRRKSRKSNTRRKSKKNRSSRKKRNTRRKSRKRSSRRRSKKK